MLFFSKCQAKFQVGRAFRLGQGFDTLNILRRADRKFCPDIANRTILILEFNWLMKTHTSPFIMNRCRREPLSFYCGSVKLATRWADIGTEQNKKITATRITTFMTRLSLSGSSFFCLILLGTAPLEELSVTT